MSRCKACNKCLSLIEMSADGRIQGLPDDLCTACRSISAHPDEADNMPQHLDHLLWDELDLGEHGDE